MMGGEGRERITKKAGDLPEYKKTRPLEQEQPTIDRIRTAIDKLNEQGIKVTTSSIANEIRVSRQRVHEALQRADELNLLPNKAQKNKNALIAETLKKLDTSHLSINDIHKLPIDGLSDISLNTLSYLLKENGIPHSFSLAQKLSKIDTANHTVKELHEMVGGSFFVLRSFLYEQRIPFKNKKARGKINIRETVLNRINGLDSSQLTLQELHNLIGEGIRLKSFRQFICNQQIPYKKAPRDTVIRGELSKIRRELQATNIDPAQHTVRELYELIGNGRTYDRFSSAIYKSNIPYKKVFKVTVKRGELPKIERELQELNIDSAQHTIRELYKLIGNGRTYNHFRSVIYKNKIPYKHSNSPSILLDRLSGIETQNYSIKQLARMIGTTHPTLAPLIAEHNIPTYKDRRPKEEMAPIWKKLHSINTEQYTADELVSLLDNKVRKNVMLKYLDKNGMKYKKKRGANNFDKLLNIDTSQYTAQELHSMTGGNLKQLQNYLAKHKFSYKKAKSGPKPKNQRAIH
ncbi:hypothetical protein [Ralstonia pseudosolanacearum]